MLEGDVGVRHKGLLLSVAKFLYPKLLIKTIDNFFPIALYLLLTVKK